jgi:hypothetical protein
MREKYYELRRSVMYLQSIAPNGSQHHCTERTICTEESYRKLDRFVLEAP